MFNLLNLEYESIVLDLATNEHKSSKFLELNPLGEIPVLVDGEVVIRDSNAALVYLAAKYDKSGLWLPRHPEQAALIQSWLTTSSKELFEGPCKARLAAMFGMPFDQEASIELAYKLLQTLFEPHLGSRQWLVGDNATIADIANYSYVAAAPEGGIDLTPYPNVVVWLRRIEKLTGFVQMTAARSY